jgi:hypothetical protein
MGTVLIAVDGGGRWLGLDVEETMSMKVESNKCFAICLCNVW